MVVSQDLHRHMFDGEFRSKIEEAVQTLRGSHNPETDNLLINQPISMRDVKRTLKKMILLAAL